MIHVISVNPIEYCVFSQCTMYRYVIRVFVTGDFQSNRARVKSSMYSKIDPKSKRPQNESQIGHIFQIE